MSGTIALEAFSLVDTTGELVSSFKSFSVHSDSVNTTENIYRFTDISLIEPYMKFAMYDDGINFDRLMHGQSSDTGSIAPAEVVEYANIFQMIAAYVLDITKKYIVSNYSADQFRLVNGKQDLETPLSHFRKKRLNSLAKRNLSRWQKSLWKDGIRLLCNISP